MDNLIKTTTTRIIGITTCGLLIERFSDGNIKCGHLNRPCSIDEWFGKVSDYCLSDCTESQISQIIQRDKKMTRIDFVKTLECTSYLMCIAAIQGLAKIGNEKSIDAIKISLKQHVFFRVRVASAKALGEIGKASDIPALINAMRDKNSYVKLAVTTSLGQLGCSLKIAKPLKLNLIHTLLTAMLNYDWQVRREGIDALIRVNDENAIPILINLLSDESWRVREAAATVLVAIGDIETIKTLLRLTRKDKCSAVRRIADEQLHKKKYPF